MNAEKLNEMASGFEEMIKLVEDGEMTVQDVKDAIDEFKPQLEMVLTMLEAVANDEKVEGISELQVIAMKASIENEKLNFDYKSQKRTIIAMLEMLEQMDKRIESDIFLKFFIDIMLRLEPTVSKMHDDAGKAMRKAIKKFNKNREL
jgi:hypothetical protein